MASTQTERAGFDRTLLDSVEQHLRGLHTALISDVLDELGHRDSWLGFDVSALVPGTRVAGRAFTMRTEPVDEVPAVRYVNLLGAYPRMSQGDVVVIGTNRDEHSGIWGELLSIAARERGVVGTVTDGLVRDVAQLEALGFPVFSRGGSPLDSAGRQEVIEVQAPVSVGECLIHPGDVIVGDHMGVVVIPQAMATQVVRLATDRARQESGVREALKAGRDIGSVFDEVGLL